MAMMQLYVTLSFVFDSILAFVGEIFCENKYWGKYIYVDCSLLFYLSFFCRKYITKNIT